MINWISNLLDVTFFLVACISFAELCLTASLLASENWAIDYPNVRYHSLLIYFLVITALTVSFTVVFAIFHILHGRWVPIYTHMWTIFGFVVGLVRSAITWAIAAGMLRTIIRGGMCDGMLLTSLCHHAMIMEGLGWTVFTLCLFAILDIIAAYAWVVILFHLGRC